MFGGGVTGGGQIPAGADEQDFALIAVKSRLRCSIMHALVGIVMTNVGHSEPYERWILIAYEHFAQLSQCSCRTAPLTRLHNLAKHRDQRVTAVGY
ncbi:hypothetical protein KRMM14A1259_18810 [Krasilnikovia sp. MM14-A1259]